MLEEARRAQNNLAWLRDSRERRALYATAWAAEPVAGRVSFFAPDFAMSAAPPGLSGEEMTWPHAYPARLPGLRHRVEPSAALFDRLHEDILNRIGRHEFEKVVPIVCEELEYAGDLQPAMFPKALEAHEHQFSYGFALDGEGLAGITPELLFAVENGVLHTMALAGTGRVDGPSLLEDPKERREHQLVIDHIVAELSLWGTAEVGATSERDYGNLKHLYTPIRLEFSAGKLPSFMDLVVRLHPTAALGGWPRRPAVEWLARQDFHVGRRRFGAPFGFQDGTRMRCVVAIRCLQWHGPRATLSAGCGVVVGSQPLREWRELVLKRRSVYRNLGLEL
jgi:menaquinone-specific isochorismate synthase